MGIGGGFAIMKRIVKIKWLISILLLLLSISVRAQSPAANGAVYSSQQTSSLIAVTNFTLPAGVTQVVNTYTNTSGGANARMNTPHTFASGSVFIVQINASVTEDGGFLAISVNSGGDPRFQANLIEWKFNTSTTGRWKCQLNNTGYDTFSNVTFSTVIPLARIMGNGSAIAFEQSLDNGATWTVIASNPGITQAASLYYVEGEFNSNSGTNGNTIRNVLSSPSIN